VTLIEMVVVLAILGIMAGITALALGGDDAPDPARARAARLAEVRRQAIDTRRPVAFELADSGGVRRGVALPDGRVVADSALGVDPLTGRADAAAR
jgi:prepilin-type N-terminal cleavage/methylation domain-containing protein